MMSDDKKPDEKSSDTPKPSDDSNLVQPIKSLEDTYKRIEGITKPALDAQKSLANAMIPAFEMRKSILQSVSGALQNYSLSTAAMLKSMSLTQGTYSSLVESMRKSLMPLNADFSNMALSAVSASLTARSSLAAMSSINNEFILQLSKSLLPLSKMDWAVSTISEAFATRTNMGFEDYINDVIQENASDEVDEVQKKEFVDDVLTLSNESCGKPSSQQKLMQLFNKWKDKNAILFQALRLIIWILGILFSTWISVKLQNANIHENPSTSSSIVEHVQKDTVLKTVDENRYWYKVELESKNGHTVYGWISKRSVKRIENDSEESSDAQ